MTFPPKHVFKFEKVEVRFVVINYAHLDSILT